MLLFEIRNTMKVLLLLRFHEIGTFVFKGVHLNLLKVFTINIFVIIKFCTSNSDIFGMLAADKG